MKPLTIACYFFISFNFLTAQIDINGTWEFEARDLQEQPTRGYNQEFSFWMKFTDGKVIMSNSNNRQISAQAGIWSYNLGTWYQNKDTIFVEIIEKENISTNTGMAVNLSDKITMNEKKEKKNVRLLVHERADGKIEMMALDRFMFSIPRIPEEYKKSKIKFAVVGLEEKECFVMKKSAHGFFWTDKI